MTAAPQMVDVVVTDIADIAEGIKSYRLAPLAGGPLPSFSAGAHIMLEMRDGAVLRRSAYSLTGSLNGAGNYTIAVRRHAQGRGGSVFLHDRVHVGSKLAVGHPVNLFPLHRRARKHLLIAGGIGITPLLAMVAELTMEARAFELHYAVRSRDHAAFADQLAGMCGDNLHLYISAEGRRLDTATLLGDQPLGTHLYVCGPEALTEDVLAAARGLGWPEESLHSERFVAPAIGRPYEVTLAKSGVTVAVGSHQSMLDALEHAGVDVPSLCRGGACGQCETRVVACDGIIQHHDHYLSEADKAATGKVMPCVSRFEGRRLVLDL
ncbi:PDR/VanB family oxidoreductase [Bradyrhizobium sp. HKCCYLRH3099]|uniref:PDR/VanB family oxidoreductase n=1 Tax=unclassified Bradyrhizobium TaxID=2631580 RepID=UPI003EC047E3